MNDELQHIFPLIIQNAEKFVSRLNFLTPPNQCETTQVGAVAGKVFRVQSPSRDVISSVPLSGLASILVKFVAEKFDALPWLSCVS